jgi:hypothetical protein
MKAILSSSLSERQMTLKYYDANLESYVTHEGAECVRSGAGWSGDVEYGVLYRLANGMFLGGMRHKDRNDLMTDIVIGSRREATPACWR